MLMSAIFLENTKLYTIVQDVNGREAELYKALPFKWPFAN